MRNVLKYIKNFTRREDGVIASETAIILPLLFWALAAMAIYFDAVRTKSAAVKATHTISDMLSRETNAITPEYLDGAIQLYDDLVLAPQASTGTVEDEDGNEVLLTYASMRVTVVTYDADTDHLILNWSEVRGDEFGALNEAQLNNYEDSLPVMADADTLIIVETTMPYYQPFEFGGDESTKIGLGGTGIGTYVYARPRYAPQLVFSES